MSTEVQDDASCHANGAGTLIWRYTKQVAFVNGLLAVVGIGVALYAYFELPIPATISHYGLDKFARPLEPESAFSYLFAFPIFQIWIAIMPVWGGWRATQSGADERKRRQIETFRKLFPRAQPAELSIERYRLFFACLVIAEVGLLFATIFRVVFATVGFT